MAGMLAMRRPVTTKTQADIAQEARRHRPVSPDLSIYQPQLTWVMSGLHRTTGVALATAYLAVPSIDSAAIISTVADLPEAVKVAGKFTLAWPFTFHAANGIRHLIWDTTSALTLKGVYTTGWIVNGASVAGAIALASI
ncbi:hypothetical protein BDF19DRAFT_411185 [Syncephalis fuscata]|nr:hypothetical protein BDF19DRAFT_411185 [Syncephalis fuscata]